MSELPTKWADLHRTTDVDTVREFFTEAGGFLQYLGKKPHVLVLDHPMDLVKQYHKEVKVFSHIMPHIMRHMRILQVDVCFQRSYVITSTIVCKA